MSARVWFWLLSLSVLWGGSFFFAKVALVELAPLTVVFCRVALGALVIGWGGVAVLLGADAIGSGRGIAG